MVYSQKFWKNKKYKTLEDGYTNGTLINKPK